MKRMNCSKHCFARMRVCTISVYPVQQARMKASARLEGSACAYGARCASSSAAPTPQSTNTAKQQLHYRTQHALGQEGKVERVGGRRGRQHPHTTLHDAQQGSGKRKRTQRLKLLGAPLYNHPQHPHLRAWVFAGACESGSGLLAHERHFPFSAAAASIPNSVS